MADISVAILGLGRLGTSFGLALERYNAAESSKNHFTITGYDSNSRNRNAAKKQGAIAQATGSVINAAEDKDLVIVAVPYAETRRTFRDIAGRITSRRSCARPCAAKSPVNVLGCGILQRRCASGWRNSRY